MTDLTPQEILARVPQQPPMRFIDEILEVDGAHILAAYTWSERDCDGHFPGNPVVPGVKLVEMCAQVGNVAWGIYHMASKTSAEDLHHMVGVFTEIEHGKFLKMVRPGERVLCRAVFGEDGYFRDNKLVAQVRIHFAGGPKDGQTIFAGKTSGMWVPRDTEAQK